MIPLLFLLAAAPTAGIIQDTLYAVEVYGLRSVPEASVRAAIGLGTGDPVPETTDSIRARVVALPGVADVDVSAVCCSETGGTSLYVGIRETGTPPLTWRPSPTGDARLPAAIVALGERFESALVSAVQRGASDEDGSRGYALAGDSLLRSVQEAFVGIAAQQMDTLVSVLRGSADAAHRALAAQIVAYGEDRHQVARELLYAVGDPSDGVRNNATRALAVLAQWVNEHPDAGISIPAAPFIGFLNSVSWTDRNKGVFVLMPLTASRSPALLEELRTRALPSLVEMARWRSVGHALGPFLILARVAGMDDGASFQAWQAGEREAVIARAQTGSTERR